MKLYDLSQPFYNNMPAAPNIGTFTSQTVKTHAQNGLQVTGFQTFSHTGTHLDAPIHMIPNGKTIDQLPPERFIGRCHVINALKGPFGEITVDDVLSANVQIEPGDFIFFNTGWGEKFNDPDYVDASSISVELADWLVQKKVGIVGIDCNTVDITYALRKAGFDFPVHHRLLENEILVIEHLNLMEVGGKTLEVMCFPLNIIGSDGAPVRVIGMELN